MDHRAFTDLINRRMHRVLDAAEIGLLPEQFQAFRRLTLAEFGRDGLEKEIAALCREAAGTEWNGTGRIKSGKKGGSS